MPTDTTKAPATDNAEKPDGEPVQSTGESVDDVMARVGMSEPPTPGPSDETGAGRTTKAELDEQASSGDSEEPTKEPKDEDTGQPDPPEAQTGKEQETEDDGPQLDEATRTNASKLGISDEELSEMQPDDIRRMNQMARTVARRESRWGRERRDFERRLQEAERGAGKQNDGEGDDGEKPPAGEATDASVEDFQDADWGEETGQQKFNQMAQTIRALQSEIEALKPQVQQAGALAQSAEEQQRQQDERATDEFFASEIDREVLPDFGDGSWDTIEQGSDHEQARIQLLDEAGDIRERIHELTGETITIQDALRRALLVLYPDEAVTMQVSAKESQIADDSRKRRNTGVQRPSQRHTRPTPEAEDAQKMENVGDVMRRVGLA